MLMLFFYRFLQIPTELSEVNKNKMDQYCLILRPHMTFIIIHYLTEVGSLNNEHSVLFDWVLHLRPSQQYFSHARMFPGLNQY